MQKQKNISCLIIDDEVIARDIIAAHLSKITNISVIASCSNAMQAFNAINNHKIDLVFLDINMPEISGISFAKSINKDIKIIFTTAYRDYAVEYYPNSANGYDGLVDFYLEKKDKINALKNADRAFGLNKDEYYKNRIKSIKNMN